ncbi:homologous-pairing protein 2 homolog isoform X2 [Rhinopithecus roxellana]|uniref:homologous-pairing protein 2 homolog isoform X2 n=1 Tax=Rhinopithecus roxellana TaxID=61622 RepID=UPI00123770CF|nr:homologous-pairing protein 2 homolog isoform X2 [Rhinopithecus roxellana]
MLKFRPEMNYGVREGSPCCSGRLPLQPITVRGPPPRPRKEPSPRATATFGFLTAGILLRYLQEQNRPYSAQDVFGNLQREHGLGKAVVVKTLEQLAQQGKIKEKMYGKQKIYFADQDPFDMVSDADLQGLDGKIVALTAKVQSLQQSCRYMEAELKELSSALTTPEMQKEIQELKKECAGYRERLKNIKAATNHVTPEEKEQVYRERQKYCKEWRKRKRMATELSDAILEGYPKSKKQFFEEVGIETDEDYNVTLPDP